MKKLINYSFLILVGLLVVSCSKESSSPSLAGKWHTVANGAKGSGSTIVWTLDANSSTVCGMQNYMEINSNGTIAYQEYYTNPITGACVLNVEPNLGSTSVTWVRTGDDVIITDSDFTTVPSTVTIFKARIVSLTDSELISQDYDQDNVDLTDSYTKFSRQ